MNYTIEGLLAEIRELKDEISESNKVMASMSDTMDSQDDLIQDLNDRLSEKEIVITSLKNVIVQAMKL